jgi:hypothetical protein
MYRSQLLTLPVTTLTTIVLLIGILCSAEQPDPPPLPSPTPVYSIRMQAEYDPEQGRITGTQHMVWHNRSTADISELQLHLYLNAFANNQSTFIQGSGGQLRGMEMEEGEWGWIEVSSIAVANTGPQAIAADTAPGQTTGDSVAKLTADLNTELIAAEERTELIDTETFLAPDDGNAQDRTVVSYQLPRPLAPGESIDVAIEFEGQLPSVFARTGKHGDYALGGQWFPKIAVFEDADHGGRSEPGWNCHQYHPHSEFYADFGEYDVTLTLPARYQGKIGATGRLVDEWRDGDKVSVRFVQDKVHDFVWTGDPNFVVIEDRFDPDKDVPGELQERISATLGLPPSELELTPVDITLLVQPANLSQADRYLESIKVALCGYGLRLGAYPYSTVTLVDPPRGAMGSAGMEYPTFITLGTHPLLGLPPFNKLRAPEGVTIHELGHNYFQGILAFNEFEEPWLDEGINSYYDMIVGEDAYDYTLELLGMKISALESNRGSVAGGNYRDPILKKSWEFSRGGYGSSSYQRPAVMLRQLENILGPADFHPAMRHFFQTWRWRNPTTENFISSLESSTGQELRWFFEQVLTTTWHLDYAVTRIRSYEVTDEEGIFWEEGSRVLKEIDKEKKSSDDDKIYHSTVTLERLGNMRLPTEVELLFDDGHSLRRQWHGEERWVTWEVDHPAKLTSAEIDPDQKLLLDIDRINNSRRMEPSSKASSKLLVHILYWLQNLCSAASLLG